MDTREKQTDESHIKKLPNNWGETLRAKCKLYIYKWTLLFCCTFVNECVEVTVL